MGNPCLPVGVRCSWYDRSSIYSILAAVSMIVPNVKSANVAVKFLNIIYLTSWHGAIRLKSCAGRKKDKTLIADLMVRAALPAQKDSSAGVGYRLDAAWLSERCFGNGAFRRLPRTTKDTVTPHQFVPSKCESPTFTSTSLQKHLSWPFAVDGAKTRTLPRPFSAPMERIFDSRQTDSAAHYFQPLHIDERA
jgi:hypothetical protein